MEGYGVYWRIIETLHEQGGKLEKFPKLFAGLAFELQISIEALSKQIEAMLHDYNLLKENDKYIWSDRVLKNIDARKAKHQLKADAGRLGGIRSGISRRIQQNEAPLEANEQKESKGKERKGNKRELSPPSLRDIEEYIKEKNYNIDAKVFHNYFTESGWVDSKGQKVRNWKQKIITWDSHNTKGNPTDNIGKEWI